MPSATLAHHPCRRAGRGLAALAGLAVGFAAACGLAGPLRPDAPEGPKSLPRTLGSYAGSPGGAEVRPDLPTLAGEADDAAEDNVRRLASGLVTVAGETAAEASPDALAGRAAIVIAPPSADPQISGRDQLESVVRVQHGADWAGRAETVPDERAGAGVTALDAGIAPADGDWPGALLAPAIDPGRDAAAAFAGIGGILAPVPSVPGDVDGLGVSGRRPGQPAAPRSAAALARPPAPPELPAPPVAERIARLDPYLAYIAAGSMLGAALMLLVILRIQPRARRRRSR